MIRLPKFNRASAAPYLFLIGVALVTLLILALRGLNFGFWGDVLSFEYHYQTLGIRGGMNWLIIDHWGRHLLGAIYSAPLHILFPNNATVWYVTSFLTHFGSGLAFFWFLDTLLRRRLRWLTITAALIFFFSTAEAVTSFEFPTIAARNGPTILTFVSLWAYLECLRTKKRGWYGLSLLTFIVSVMSYEQNAAFFVLYPLIAYFEEMPHTFQMWRGWFWRSLVDVSLYAAFLIAYIVILLQVFPGNSNFTFSPSFILRQIADSLNLMLNPLQMISRAAPALQGIGLLITLVLALAVFILIYLWMARADSQRGDGLLVIGIGISMIVANVVSIAPTIFTVGDNPRLLYLAGGGVSLLVFGIVHLIKARTVKGILAAGIAAFLIAPGITEVFQFQQQYLHEAQQRQTTLNAIAAAVRLRSDAQAPYLVLVSDADPDRDLDLHPHDINFPYMLDLALGVKGLDADALYFDLPANQKPQPDQAISTYVGPFIVTDDKGIYSAVRHGVPIDPQRLVIVSYDLASQTAHILDELPPDILSRANIVQRAPVLWKTNRALLASPP